MESEEKLVNMAGPAMRMMAEMTKDIKAQNVLGEFVEEEFGGLFEGGNEMAAGFLVKMTVQEANEQPQVVLKKFLRFYNSFRAFYTTLEKSVKADANPPTLEEEVEAVEEEVEEEIQAQEENDASTTENTDKE